MVKEVNSEWRNIKVKCKMQNGKLECNIRLLTTKTTNGHERKKMKYFKRNW